MTPSDTKFLKRIGVSAEPVASRRARLTDDPAQMWENFATALLHERDEARAQREGMRLSLNVLASDYRWMERDRNSWKFVAIGVLTTLVMWALGFAAWAVWHG